MQMQQGQDNYTKKPEHIDRLVQERHNFIANTLSYVFLALTHRYIFLKYVIPENNSWP